MHTTLHYKSIINYIKSQELTIQISKVKYIFDPYRLEYMLIRSQHLYVSV